MNYNYTEIAAKWRDAQAQTDNRAKTGVVLIWRGEVYGWKNVLRDAASEQPGAIAVDTKGHVFIAEGGDAYNGADGWVAAYEE